MAVRYGDVGARPRKGAAIASPRRVAAALGLGAALAIAGLAASHAGAHGPAVLPGLLPMGSQPSGAPHATYSIAPFEASAPARPRADNDGPRRRHRIITIAGGGERASRAGGRVTYGGSQPMCVRLCDGFFFPLPVATGDLAGQTASCNSLCPDAPTEVFYRNGGDSIEGSVSASGKAYTSLPVSLRYRSEANATCTCHRDPVAYAPLKDWTLRAGDAVMTPAGFMVFRGAERSSHSAGEFSALSGAGLAPTQRAAMQEMERVSLRPTHPTLRQWLAQGAPTTTPVAKAPAPPAPAQKVARNDDKIRLLVWRGGQD